jgi:uncharacterized protein (DUF433 family)
LFLVTNPERLGGKPTIRHTRFSASFILSCLAEGMSYEEIVREYSEFPRESIPEVLRYAAEVIARPAMCGCLTSSYRTVCCARCVSGESPAAERQLHLPIDDNWISPQLR